MQVQLPAPDNIVQVQLPAPDKTTTPIPLFPPLQTLAPPGAPVENADDHTLEEDVVGLDRLTAQQDTVSEAQFKEPRPPPISEGTDDDDWNDDTGGTNQGPAYYQECVSLFGKKVFMKPVNE